VSRVRIIRQAKASFFIGAKGLRLTEGVLINSGKGPRVDLKSL
jgi:hypothetical protein